MCVCVCLCVSKSVCVCKTLMMRGTYKYICVHTETHTDTHRYTHIYKHIRTHNRTNTPTPHTPPLPSPPLGAEGRGGASGLGAEAQSQPLHRPCLHLHTSSCRIRLSVVVCESKRLASWCTPTRQRCPLLPLYIFEGMVHTHFYVQEAEVPA